MIASHIFSFCLIVDLHLSVSFREVGLVLWGCIPEIFLDGLMCVTQHVWHTPESIQKSADFNDHCWVWKCFWYLKTDQLLQWCFRLGIPVFSAVIELICEYPLHLNLCNPPLETDDVKLTIIWIVWLLVLSSAVTNRPERNVSPPRLSETPRLHLLPVTPPLVLLGFWGC